MQTLRLLADTARLPFVTLDDRVLPMKYDSLHLEVVTQRATAPTLPLLLTRSPAFRPPQDSRFLARAADAAEGVLLSRDPDGGRKLNATYLLRVLTVATAHVAERPYWRRSASQPFADFGSMVGNDAGMNVFHVIQPDLMELVKSREPRFVSRFHERFSRKSN